MQSMTHSRKTCLALGLALAIPVVLAQTDDVLVVDVAPCRTLGSPTERLACYDALGSTAQRPPAPVLNASSPPAVPPAAAADARSPASVPEDAPPAAAAQADVAGFGRNTPSQEARVLANPDGEQELHDTITSLREREPGRWLITLASGQVWYQSNSQRMRLRVGNEVRIYPSPLGGSWRMARADGEQSGFIQVTRIK